MAIFITIIGAITGAEASHRHDTYSDDCLVLRESCLLKVIEMFYNC